MSSDVVFDAPVKVLLVDDHQMFAESLLRLLERVDGIHMTGSVGTLADALASIRLRAPEVVVLDHDLPDAKAPDSVRRVLRVAPRARVLVLTAMNDERVLAKALDGGAHGFVTKDRAAGDLVAVIATVAAGGTAVPEDLKERLLARPVRGPGAPVLSAREQEVLQLLAQGCSTREIADRLYLSVNTVRNHVQAVLRATGARDRREAVVNALREGWVEVN